MTTLFVVGHPRELPVDIPGARVVTARAYLADPAYAEKRGVQVINLCRIDRYQNRGYYVSLLAEARGHRPLPEVRTIEDLRGARDPLVEAELAEQAQAALREHATGTFELDAYFGLDPAGAHPALAAALFALLRAPLLRARFQRSGDAWRLVSVKALGAADIAPVQRARFVEAALDFLGHATAPIVEARSAQPALAILASGEGREAPSNALALEHFEEAGRALGLRVARIGRGDIDRLPEFDALFVRDTTAVDNHTYRFARRAAAEGLVVIDDPDSILKCGNKVYLNELLTRHRVPVPKTLMVHRANVGEVIPTLGLPCIVKQPDGAFSLGVTKIESAEALQAALPALLAKSDLVVAQEWLPTTYDWRVGVLDRRPLFVCKYFMAPGHWQVIKRESHRTVEGTTAALSVGEAPKMVVDLALRAANLIGDGLYGVDLKQVGEQCYVIEVNDNPNVDAGNEDAVLKEALYREIMGVFLRRILERRAART